VSDVTLVDSTPPVSGRFLSPLRWTRSDVSNVTVTSVDVAWQDFSDGESGVARYRLLAGWDYNGEELSQGRLEVAHSASNHTQRHQLQLQHTLASGDVLHLKLMAENSLGMASPLVRAAFTILHDDASGMSGSLVLQRHSCRASYCTSECTCAATGKVCVVNQTSPCVELEAPSRPDLTLLPVMGHDSAHHQAFSASSKCLKGLWTLQNPQALLNVSRFQFSFSLAHKSAGEGVFDVLTEPAWYDVGLDTTALHCLPAQRRLVSGLSYTLHVRVWPSPNTYTDFTSQPMMVDHTPPAVRRGKSVIESDASCSKDLDYVNREESYVTACWNDVFRDSDSGVARYEVWVGTSPHGRSQRLFKLSIFFVRFLFTRNRMKECEYHNEYHNVECMMLLLYSAITPCYVSMLNALGR
jgi:hypothetical protein